MSGWSEYRFLESATNLKLAISNALDRTPNTRLATDAATCLRQGRQFFESAEAAPIEIKPLLMQYGVIAMGKAISACRDLRQLGTLTQSHGLTDTSEEGARITDLRVRIDARGSFQEFNQAIRNLESVCYFGERYEACMKFYETTNADALTGRAVSFDDLFSRMPSHVELYTKTFDRDAKVLHANFHAGKISNTGELRIFVRGYASISRDALLAKIGELRGDHDFLRNWVLISAQCAYGDLQLRFSFVDPAHVQQAEDTALIFDEQTSSFYRVLEVPESDVKWHHEPPPISGSLFSSGGGNDIIFPLYGARLSAYSIIYLSAFMLGSLVRYRPQTWVHALSSRVTADRELDDKPVALVEQFIASTLQSFPSVVVNAITTRREDILDLEA